MTFVGGAGSLPAQQLHVKYQASASKAATSLAAATVAAPAATAAANGNVAAAAAGQAAWQQTQWQTYSAAASKSPTMCDSHGPGSLGSAWL